MENNIEQITLSKDEFFALLDLSGLNRKGHKEVTKLLARWIDRTLYQSNPILDWCQEWIDQNCPDIDEAGFSEVLAWLEQFGPETDLLSPELGIKAFNELSYSGYQDFVDVANLGKPKEAMSYLKRHQKRYEKRKNESSRSL